MAPAMVQDDRVSVFLRKAEVFPPPSIASLAEAPAVDFPPSQDDLDQARSMLAEQRTSEPGYKWPELQTRHTFRSANRKERKSNVEKWIFTKHEIGKTFGSLLDRAPLAPPSIAQALLSHTSPTSIDELWCHVHDRSLEKKMSRRFFPRRSSSSIIPELPWLDRVTRQENLDYICLLCQTGVEQEELDRAFSVALSLNSMETMKILLNLGSNASSCQEVIRGHVRLENLALATLLLSAPQAMSAEAWRLSMEPEIQKASPNIFLLCLAHRADVVCGSLLLQSLAAKNLVTTAIILAYAASDEDFCDVRQPACELTAAVQDHGLRLQLFDILALSGFLTDSPVLREELMKNVKSRQLQLVRILVDAGVSVDIEPHCAVNFAVSHMDLDMLELFRKGTFSSPVSLALNFVPDSTSEPNMLFLMDIFGPMGVLGEPLDAHLIRAVRKQQVRLTETLLAFGASIEFRDAFAVHLALQRADFTTLNILLQHKCSAEILSTVIPTAMDLKPRSTRLQAITHLIRKGILAQKLGVPLQRLVAEDGDVDITLIRLVLQQQPPLDDVGDVSKNAVFVAARRGLLSVLQLLCDAAPRRDTLSSAITIAFSALGTHGYDVAFAMIKTLLEKGGTGQPAHQILLAAARQDCNLELVRLLVDHGADANYGVGACFNVAIEGANLQLLEVLCAGCPPSLTSIKSLLFTAVKPEFFNLQALELLLRSNSTIGTVLDGLWASEKFKGNTNITQIVSCLLRHGLNVDLKDGILLCFAMQEQNSDLLGKVLSVNPSMASLTAAFREATSIQQRSFQLLAMRLLLEKSKSTEIGQSKALLQETHHAIDDDFRGLELVLRHKADVDFKLGAALQEAAAAGSLAAVAALLSVRPILVTICLACLATASSPTVSSDQKQKVLQLLLDANGGVPAEGMSEILSASVGTLPECTQLPELLLVRGATVDFETLKIATRTSSRPLFMVLATSISSLDTIRKLFKDARKNIPGHDRRYWIYEYLLKRGIAKEEVSDALIDSLKPGCLGDFSLPKLLLEHGASVEYKGGAAITVALNSNLLGAVILLSQYFVDDKAANLAFGLARKCTSLDQDTRFEVYQCFLEWSIDHSSIYLALLENLNSELSDAPTVELLLEKGADPNKDGARCFVVASGKGAEDNFRTLSRHGNPDLQLVLRSLLDHFTEEWQVAWWFGACLEEQFNSVLISQDDMLFQCMRKFPHGTTLLKLLLDKGVLVSAKVTSRLCPGWEPEICTALIWALSSSKPRIGNDPILTLLSRGGNKALPAYSTPQTKVSAGFACVLDNTRTDVLKALIDLDRSRVMEHTMLESKFHYLATYPKVSNPDLGLPENADQLRLRVASLHTGNFKAFLLMQSEDEPNDGMLHMAAMLALPKFVQWLLDHNHDPNCQKQEMGPMIPLALVCASTPQPSCRIVNNESDWFTRQKQTMKLLAPQTDPNWTYLRKTVLHIALDKGHHVTKALIEVLNISRDSQRNERYLYVDKNGIYYSPDQYVRRVLTIDEGEKKALVNILKECRMMSRYYRAVEPKAGTQPEGYHGLPLRLQELWDEHSRILKVGSPSIDTGYPSFSLRRPAIGA